MNPYLQARWRAAHARLIVYLGDQIQGQLPPGLVATIEDGVSVDLDEPASTYRPDIHVREDWEAPETSSDPSQAATIVASPKAFVVKHVPKPAAENQRHIEILDTASGDKVVTVIEVLSPTNKIIGSGAELYLAKQSELIEAKVNLVEIDLIRDRKWSPVFGYVDWPVHLRTECLAAITRMYDPAQTEIYPLPLRDSLPKLPVPLRRRDADIFIDLQEAIDRTVENSGMNAAYYQGDPTPLLSQADDIWLDQILRAAKIRPLP